MYTKSVISLHAELLQSMAKSILNKTKKQKHIDIVNKNKNLSFQTSLSKKQFPLKQILFTTFAFRATFWSTRGILIFVDHKNFFHRATFTVILTH